MYIRLFGKFVAKLKEKFQDYELFKKEKGKVSRL